MQATAEARRLNALAKRLGMVLSDYAEPRHLRGWWKAPAERELTADEEAEWCGALDDADRGEARREAVALARAKEAAKTAGPPTPRVPRDPYACPARVSPDVWDAVPRDLRPATALYAGGHHFYGAEQAKRVAAIIAAVAALAPESDPARVKALADKRWGGATREVASSIVETMAAEDAQYVVDREKAEAAIATIIERKEVYVPAAARRREARDNAITAVSVVVNGDSSTIRTEDRQRVIIVAAGIMQADETLTPEEAVEKSVWHWFHLARR